MDNLVAADLRNASPASSRLDFHAQESEEVLRSVESSLSGLTADQAAKRRRHDWRWSERRDGLLILGVGFGVLLILESGKIVMRKTGWMTV